MDGSAKDIIFCSTSLAMYDRRMQRITQALSDSGYQVKWLSRYYDRNSIKSGVIIYDYIKCIFSSGILFYLEFNIRLFFKLLRSSEGSISCIDLDTLLAATLASKLKGKKLIFDAHEIFYEVPELTGKPFKKWIWKQVARWCIPKTDLCYTVNNSLKKHYEKHYSTSFSVIRNVPDVSTQKAVAISNNKTMAYLGAVNKGRGVEIAIQSLQQLIDYKLVIIGEGDEYNQMIALADSLNISDRVDFRGYTSPDKIFSILSECSIGLNVLVAESENYRLSLANKFFDYMHAGLPSVNMRYPEYESILEEHEVGVMIDEYEVDGLVKALIRLEDAGLFEELAGNTIKYRGFYTWGREKVGLVGVYESLLYQS